jgi:uncharacterized protein YjbI with pentapeptide repeats
MKIIKPQALGLLTRPFEFRREFWLGVAALSFVPVGDEAALLPETAMWPFLAEELPPDQPLDAAIPKSCAEFVSVAHAHAPRGAPVAHLDVGVQLGPVVKKLRVFGDRALRHGRLTDAVPFATMPLGWARAYGGLGCDDNPDGKGAAPDPADPACVPIPNVLDPKLAGEALRTPSGFGPIDQTRPARAKLAGTYDDAWLKNDFPGMPRDIDWRFFNVAPADQRLPEGWAGDETYAFMNLHPTQPLQRGRLPGIAPRIFAVRKADEDGFEEVPLALTTVWFFPHRERLVMVHHGRLRVAEEDASDVAHVVLGADPLGAPRAAAAFRDVMLKRLDKQDGALHALRDEDLVPAEWLRPDPALAPPDDSALREVLGRGRKRAEREQAAQVEQLKALGLDPGQFVRPLSPEPDIPSLDDLPAVLAEALAMAETQQAAADAAMAERKAEATARMVAAGMSEEAARAKLDAKPKGPPGFSAAGMRASLEQHVTAMRVLGQLTFALEQQLASPEVAAQWKQAEDAARAGYRMSAHHQDSADSLPAGRSAEIRAILAQDPAEARALYDLHGADLSGLDLSGVDLSGVCLDGADLTGTSLAGALLVNAVLAHARAENCVLDGADLSGANLGRARLAGASLRKATLKKAVLAGADLTSACLAGVDMRDVGLAEATVAGADLSDADADGMLAAKLSLAGLSAPGISLRKAKFIECDLSGAHLAGACLEEALFVETSLADANLVGARMRKTVLVRGASLAGADLRGADLTEANLREAPMQGADLTAAALCDADLSGADLTGAVLECVAAAGCRMTAATLRDAELPGADLARADLGRADLRGADMAGGSVYEANLPRVKLDAGTRRAGMLRTRMRYLPLHAPPPEAAA